MKFFFIFKFLIRLLWIILYYFLMVISLLLCKLIQPFKPYKFWKQFLHIEIVQIVKEFDNKVVRSKYMKVWDYFTMKSVEDYGFYMER